MKMEGLYRIGDGFVEKQNRFIKKRYGLRGHVGELLALGILEFYILPEDVHEMK